VKIDEMANKFKSEQVDKETFDSQTTVLINLNKKIKQVQDENEHLKKLLKNSNPIIVNMDEAGLDEELIARSELRKLRQTSQDRELTMEETKKVEIYSKIMANIANKPKVLEVTAKNLKSEELIGLLDSATDE
jgi:hypothetical protein